jgi:uncharacterized alkaline shock family protein YloU
MSSESTPARGTQGMRGATMTAEQVDSPEHAQHHEATGTSLQPMPTATASLKTDTGTTRIADSVVAKIAGLAARDIPGVYSMGTGTARRIGQLRSLVPGSDESSSASQGVSVQVGEREAAVDLDLVTWYGQSIVDISDAVRRNVIGQVQGMTGLRVVEVNIQIDDIHVQSQDAQTGQPRVQ